MTLDDTTTSLLPQTTLNSSSKSIYQQFKNSYTSQLKRTQNPKNATLFSATLNITNTILGAGILTIPYNFNRSGYLLGYFQQFFFAIISFYTFSLLIKSAKTAKCFSYQQLVSCLICKPVGYVAGVMILIFTSFIMVSFCVIIRENLFFLEAGWVRKVVFYVILVLGISPLSVVPELNNLQFTSFFSILCGLYIVIFTFSLFFLKFYGNLTLPEMKTPQLIQPMSFNVLKSFPGVSLAFAGHFNGLNVFQEIKNHDKKTFRKSAGISVILILTMNLLISSGYFVFCDQVTPDILQNFDFLQEYRVFAYVCNICIIIILICSYPLMMWCFRVQLLDLVCRKREIKWRWTIVIILSLNVVFGTISVFLNDVGIVLDAVSSIAGVPLVIIFPALLGVRRNYEEHDKRKKIIGMIFNITLAFIGVIIMVIGVVGCFIK